MKMNPALAAVMIVAVLILISVTSILYLQIPPDSQFTQSPPGKYVDDLDLDPERALGYSRIEDRLDMSPQQESLLSKNAFVVLNDQEVGDNFGQFYIDLKHDNIPMIVTADSIVHTTHVLFEDLLVSVEEDHLIPALRNLTDDMLDRSNKLYLESSGKVREAVWNNVAFFSVAARCLDPTATVPDYVEENVSRELDLMERAEGFEYSPIFDGRSGFAAGSLVNWSWEYVEDYSQYVPRGHYTRSESLERYFRCSMWFGRIHLASINDELTRSGIIMSDMLIKSTVSSTAWTLIRDVTELFVGRSDDMGPVEYCNISDGLFGQLPPDYDSVSDDNAIQLFSGQVRQRSWSRINSQYVLEEPTLEVPAGMRLLGQRFIPDSYIFQKLTYHKNENGEGMLLYTGDGEPFTVSQGQGPPCKGYPRGLEVFSVLGDDRAAEILEREGDTEYTNYSAIHRNLQQEFENVSAKNWSQNLYWGTLDSLVTLGENFSKNSSYPHFMRTRAWRDEKLNTALGGWTELRHDTILYGKQSFTGVQRSGDGDFVVSGYVEPVPIFYNRTAMLVKSMEDGLKKMQVLPEGYEERLARYGSLAARLEDISRKILNGREMDEEDQDIIQGFGIKLNEITDGLNETSIRTSLVADVHTQTYEERVLEEGVGKLRPLIVMADIDGRTHAFLGAVFSHYEFKHPMEDRLTDEAWREMVKSGSGPDLAPWQDSFSA